jgi:serine/threonine-protein kinase PRP4
MSPSEPSRGSRGDGEKASKPHTSDSRDGGVNKSTRLHSGASSRASRLDGSGDNMARSSYRAPAPRSPRNARRSRSPYRAPHSKRRTVSRSPSYSRSPSPPSRRGVNDRLRSRSPPRDESARAGDKRPRSSNHYHTTAHSDPRRFKVHYEKEKDDTHRDTGYSVRGKTAGADHGRLTHPARDDGRLSRNDVNLPVRRERGRLNDREPGGHAEAGRVNVAAVEKASSMTSSKASSQSTHNQISEPKPSSQSTVVQGKQTRYVPFEDINRNVHSALYCQPAKSRSLPGPCRCIDANGIRPSVYEQTLSNDIEPEPTPQLTEDELIEQRRRKREAIKAKYRSQQTPLLVQALEQNTLSAPSTPHHESSAVTSEHASCMYSTYSVECNCVIY